MFQSISLFDKAGILPQQHERAECAIQLLWRHNPPETVMTKIGHQRAM
jgi:hypothetical protein